MAAQPQRYISPQEYLTLEDRAEVRNEYYYGEVIAMAGASWNHARIMSNLVKEFTAQMAGGPCEIVFNDVRVQAESESVYYYPDIVGLCQEPRFSSLNNQVLVNPELIIEVISPGTEKIDRGRKFRSYRETPSIKEYVMISQDFPQVEQYTRKDGEGWLLRTHVNMADEVQFTCGNCRIPLSRIYDRVDLEEAPRFRIHK